MSGGAVSKACKRLRPRMTHIAAHLLQADPAEVALQDGCYRAAGRSVASSEVADAWYLRPHLLPADVDPAGLEVHVGYKPKVDTGCFTYASQARSEEHTSELQSLIRIPYAVFCLQNKNKITDH